MVDVKCMNCGVFIPEDKVSYHSKVCGKGKNLDNFSEHNNEILPEIE